MKVEKVASLKVREQWSAIVDKIHRTKGVFVVERYRKPVAAIIDFELLMELQQKTGMKLDYTVAEPDTN